MFCNIFYHMQKGRKLRIPVVVELNESQANEFIRQLARGLVEELRRDVKSPQPAQFTLEKPPRKKVKRAGMKIGPIVYRSKDVDFSLKENRVNATRELAKNKAKEKRVSLRTAATMIIFDDFRKNGLGLLINRFGDSPYPAVSEAFPEFGIKPWEMYAGRGFWRMKQNRMAAYEWLLKKTRKRPLEIDSKTMFENGLGGLFGHYRGMNRLFVDLGFVYSLGTALNHARKNSFRKGKTYPWEVNKVENGFYNNPKVRVAAIKWLIWKTGKKPDEINTNDFHLNGLDCIRKHYLGSVYRALVEAGFAYSMEETNQHSVNFKFGSEKLYPWELTSSEKKSALSQDLRTAAMRWLLHKSGKEAKEITFRDLRQNKVGKLLRMAKLKFHDYLVETGYVYSEKEIRLHVRNTVFHKDKAYPWELVNTPDGFFQDLDNRIAIMTWLVWKTGKKPQDIREYDLYENGLSGLYRHYLKKGKGYKTALREAGFDV